jgi:hypothetical protein
MKSFNSKSILFLIISLTGLLLFMGSAQAQDPSTITLKDSSGFQAAADVQSYWTEERMANAIPMPVPNAAMPQGADSESSLMAERSLVEVGEPLFAPGWSPNSGQPQPDPAISYTFDELADLADTAPMHGPAPSNPRYGPYAPFQRWTWYGSYITQDTQTLGKLFFSIGGQDYVCTASVIGEGTIATAAHCLKSDLDDDGSAETWHTNWQFCPSYYRAGGSGAPYPTRGCWSWTAAKVSSNWASQSAVDRDYACIITAPTGTVVNSKVGNVTGWAGRAFNLPSSQLVFSWGYPVGPTWPAVPGLGGEGPRPFPGYHIIAAASTEWYEVDMTAGDGQVSKYMGNDMTGGSSGGPWWIGVGHRVYEYTDTDGRTATDPPGCGTLDSPCVPGGPYINGLNSHKRCLNHCWRPSSTSGIYYQEMGSPEFRATSSDTDEAEDIFAWCLDND